MLSDPTTEFSHTITLDGTTVCRDGHRVRVVANTKTRELQVGCTKVTRAALLRLLEMSTCDMGIETVLQEGAR